MRQGPNNRRPRGRNNSGNRRPNVPHRNQTFDSNGPDVRIRGNAYQVYEKYLALARDAGAAGDRVMSENYLQHAEHYHRIILAMNEPSHGNQQQPQAGDYRNGTAREGFDQDEADPSIRDPRRGNRMPRQPREMRDNGGRNYGRSGDGAGEAAPASMGAPEAERPVIDPRDDQQPIVEFGEDPRTSDHRDNEDGDGNGRADQAGIDPSDELPAFISGSDESRDDDDGQARAPRRRRGVGRQRRTPTGAGAGGGSVDSLEAKGEDDQADLGL